MFTFSLGNRPHLLIAEILRLAWIHIWHERTWTKLWFRALEIMHLDMLEKKSQLTVEAWGFSKTMDSQQSCTKRVSKPRRNEFQISKEVCVLTVNCWTGAVSRSGRANRFFFRVPTASNIQRLPHSQAQAALWGPQKRLVGKSRWKVAPPSRLYYQLENILNTSSWLKRSSSTNVPGKSQQKWHGWDHPSCAHQPHWFGGWSKPSPHSQSWEARRHQDLFLLHPHNTLQYTADATMLYKH